MAKRAFAFHNWWPPIIEPQRFQFGLSTLVLAALLAGSLWLNLLLLHKRTPPHTSFFAEYEPMDDLDEVIASVCKTAGKKWQPKRRHGRNNASLHAEVAWIEKHHLRIETA